MKKSNEENAARHQANEEKSVTIISCGCARELCIPLPPGIQRMNDDYPWKITAHRAQQWVSEYSQRGGYPQRTSPSLLLREALTTAVDLKA